ncbi:MAG TPA: fluoride efflux transporter CrcB [Coleofasciculaceae cyanobacterium]
MPKSFIRTLIAISLGTIAGALSRYYLGLQIAHIVGSQIPYGTFIINITGCFVMGLLVAISEEQGFRIHPDLKLLLFTGFLGSYTTFSSYELDSIRLIQANHLELALLYWLGSATLGLLSLAIGMMLTRKILDLLPDRLG